ncbi:MAG: nitroreductase family protein [Bacillota bacterium]|nr:nitroreductase family protein [Bacillota bacterium]
MTRTTRHPILNEIKTRFSNRALTEKEVPQEAYEAMVEAASFAPSSFNEQPWRFYIARGERKEKLLQTLTPMNQEWAIRADALVLTVSKQTFTMNGKPNPWHLSDAGCATGFFMLEAERRGLTAHPMAGFDQKAAREAMGVHEEFALVHVMAVGYPGDFDKLSERNQARNHPAPRKPIEEIML